MTIVERAGQGQGSMRAAIASGGLAVAVGAVWYAALMRSVWAAAASGPICGHGSFLVAHCPACYAALALMATGVGVMALARV